MKKVVSKIIIFFSSVCIGYIISGNVNFDKFITSFNLNAVEFQSATETKNKLLEDVGSLKTSNKEMLKKIDKYYSDGLDSGKVLEEMKSELEYDNCFTGLLKVSGPGIIITIDDGVYDNKNDTKDQLDMKTLHDADMFTILNDLKSAGAEAIAINKHRITGLSGLTCKYAFLEFEDGDMVSAPFTIYAIGDGETMENLLLEDGSYLKRLRIRGLSVDLEKTDNINMDSANYVEMQYEKEY